MGRAGNRKRRTIEEELADIAGALRDPHSPSHQEALRRTLATGQSTTVARVAVTVANERLSGFEEALQQSFARFTIHPVKSDPGCRAKLAILEALDRLEVSDPAPFVAGARTAQKEPSWGPPIDTAGGVRSRAIAALARIRFVDFLLVAGELLADPLTGVRQVAAESLAHYGERSGAGLLLLKLRIGDSEDQVILACAIALLALAPETGLRELGPMLEQEGPPGELAAIVLGESGRDDALDLIFTHLERLVSPVDRAPLLRAVGIHRSDRARDFLLERVATGSEPEARAAIAALAARTFEPGLGERVREAGARNDRADLEVIIDEAFPR